MCSDALNVALSEVDICSALLSARALACAVGSCSVSVAGCTTLTSLAVGGSALGREESVDGELLGELASERICADVNSSVRSFAVFDDVLGGE